MARNLKLPKKIAGVKLPKKARKTANKAIKMGAEPGRARARRGRDRRRRRQGEGERKEPRADAGSFGGRARKPRSISARSARRSAPRRSTGCAASSRGSRKGCASSASAAEAAGERAKRKAASPPRPGAG